MLSKWKKSKKISMDYQIKAKKACGERQHPDAPEKLINKKSGENHYFSLAIGLFWRKLAQIGQKFTFVPKIGQKFTLFSKNQAPIEVFLNSKLLQELVIVTEWLQPLGQILSDPPWSWVRIPPNPWISFPVKLSFFILITYNHVICNLNQVKKCPCN